MNRNSRYFGYSIFFIILMVKYKLLWLRLPLIQSLYSFIFFAHGEKIEKRKRSLYSYLFMNRLIFFYIIVFVTIQWLSVGVTTLFWYPHLWYLLISRVWIQTNVTPFGKHVKSNFISLFLGLVLKVLESNYKMSYHLNILYVLNLW